MILEWLYSKQLTISIKTQNDNKINVSCSANQQNVTLHVKHDHQYSRNLKSLNIIRCIGFFWGFFCIYWDAWFFFSRNRSSVLHVECKALWEYLRKHYRMPGSMLILTWVGIIFVKILHLAVIPGIRELFRF